MLYANPMRFRMRGLHIQRCEYKKEMLTLDVFTVPSESTHLFCLLYSFPRKKPATERQGCGSFAGCCILQWRNHLAHGKCSLGTK